MQGEVWLAGNRWSMGGARFGSPTRIVSTSEVAGVRPALDEAAAHAADGNWVVGYITYDAAAGLDHRLKVPGRWAGPLVWFGVYPSPEDSPARTGSGFRFGGWVPGMSAEDHARRVGSIQEAIRRGDTYQVNLTFPMTTRFSGNPHGLFGAMVAAQPDSFAAMIEMDDAAILSVSPELFLHVEGTSVTAQPMKGTAPRGRWSAEDRALRDALLMSEKERAGNVMIVDLIRNDLGRLARFGTVDVPELFSPERHPTVWQLTSTVHAEMPEMTTLGELLAATFPSGSVTGAPKPSTMGIIADNEGTARGVYCGAIGYIAPGAKTAEFSVAIRTGVVRGDSFSYHVGGGITHDSLAGTEYEECLWKALVVTEPVRRPSLIETMRYDPALGIDLLEEHILRLTQSADYFGIDLRPDAIGEALSAVQASAPIKVRLVLGPRGSLEVELDSIPLEAEVVALKVGDMRIDPSRPIWYHKTAERDHYPDASDEFETVLLNLDGEVTETNRSNIFIRDGERWVTPPVESGCLPGIYRGKVLREKEVVVRPIPFSELEDAEEIAVTNAVRGWRKAKLIE